MVKINILTPTRKGGPYNWGNDLKYLLNRKGLRADHIHRLKSLISSPIYQDADVIHMSIPLAYRLWTRPVIFTVHGEFPIERNVWRFFYPKAIKKADIITTPSKYLKDRLELDDAIVIPNGVFPERLEQIDYPNRDVVNLITITKFYFKDKSQGILRIITILDELQKNIDKKINYTIVGGGMYLEEIKKKAEEYDVNIIFTGMLENPKDILKTGDIFLYYSYHDNFPISILEAMACGLPVISNNIGAIGEMIKNSYDGFIASDDEYGEILSDLIDDQDLRQYIGINSRKTVETRFNWNKIIDRYIQLYGDIIT